MKKKIENLSMQTQLTVVILSVIVLAFGIILYSGYSGQARSFAEEYTSSTQTILEMDVANLDQYIQGLRIFCVQPCLNVSVYNSLLKRKPLSSSEISDIKQEIQSSYHSRTDIRSYSITAMNQDLCFERNAGVGGQHILSTTTAAKLSKGQCALIAATLPNPIRFNSAKPSAYILRRQKQILRLMDLVPKFPPVEKKAIEKKNTRKKKK